MSLPVGGPSGITWNPTPVFDEEFTGSSLNTSVWHCTGNNNNLTTNSLTYSSIGSSIFKAWANSSSSGCQIQTGPIFAVGYYVEYYAYFPGTGGNPYNWPAVWTSGTPWPGCGEFDIFEGLGHPTCNYHYNPTLGAGASTSSQSGPFSISGSSWVNSWHTFGCYRARATTGSSASAAMANPVGAFYYWDGVQVAATGTYDGGEAGNLIITAGCGNTAAYGSANAIQVDYARVWQQGSGGSSYIPSNFFF